MNRRDVNLHVLRMRKCREEQVDRGIKVIYARVSSRNDCIDWSYDCFMTQTLDVIIERRELLLLEIDKDVSRKSAFALYSIVAQVCCESIIVVAQIYEELYLNYSIICVT